MSALNQNPAILADATRFAGEEYRTQPMRDRTRVAGAGYQSILATQMGAPLDAGLAERYKIGDRIGGRYEVLAIHRGSMGVVYGAFDHETKLPRALKTLQERFASTERLRDLFLEEAATWVRLGKHPFIVRAYAIEKTDGRPYVVTEYVRGGEGMSGDLRGWLGHVRLTLKLAVEMALQVAQGMQHAIRTIPGFVHRDLKPANILVDSRARAMVTDFGLIGTTENQAGTPAYMAPELWNGDSPDVPTDIYSFGCILYEMFTGHRMFSAGSVEQWKYAHLTRTPDAPIDVQPGIPEETSAFVMKCLARKPSGRPRSWDEVVSELAAQFHRMTGQPVVLDFSAYELTSSELISASYSLWKLGKYEEMLLTCNHALEIDSSIATLWDYKAYALAALGREREAVPCYEHLLQINPNDAVLWTRKGNALSREGAISCFDKALEIDPKNVAAWANKGWQLTFCERPVEAIACFDRAVEIDANCVGALNGKCLALHRLGRLDERLALVKRLEQVRENTPRIAENINDLWDCAVEDDPDGANAWYLKGSTFFGLKQYEQAIECFDRALAIDPYFDYTMSAREDKVSALLSLGRYAETIVCIDAAFDARDQINANAPETLTKKPGRRHSGPFRGATSVDFDYDSWFTKGMAFYYLRFYDAAIACFDHCLAIVEPDHENAKTQKEAALRVRDQARMAAHR